jgi:hypothetical protein
MGCSFKVGQYFVVPFFILSIVGCMDYRRLDLPGSFILRMDTVASVLTNSCMAVWK